MSRALPLAGFQVTFIGRFWVITEELVTNSSPKLTRLRGFSGYRETEKQRRQWDLASVPQI
jgi:hypothetical protein